MVDLVIHPKWILPIIPKGKVFESISVVVNDGIIVDILSTQVDLLLEYYSSNVSQPIKPRKA